MKYSSILLLTLLFVSACTFDRINYIPVEKNNGNQGTGFGKSGIHFDWVKTNVFQAGKCTQCHGANSRINLTTYESTMAAADKDGKKLIIPGDFENSKLYKEVESGRMPKGGPKLDDNLIFALAFWIKLGAKPQENLNIPPPMEPITELNFAVLEKKIFGPQCSSCHSSNGEAFYVDLTTRDAMMDKINLEDPKNSRIYKAVFSGRMPQGGPRLSNEDIALILQWISEGAKP